MTIKSTINFLEQSKQFYREMQYFKVLLKDLKEEEVFQVVSYLDVIEEESERLNEVIEKIKDKILNLKDPKPQRLAGIYKFNIDRFERFLEFVKADSANLNNEQTLFLSCLLEKIEDDVEFLLSDKK